LTRRSPPSDEGGWRRRDRATQIHVAFSGIPDAPPEAGHDGRGVSRVCARDAAAHSRNATRSDYARKSSLEKQRAQGKPGAQLTPRDRVLTEDEIRSLWRGLDREDMPWDRKTRLAIKFALTTMLRSGERLPINRDELNTENGTVDIPARRVKKRRVINQPLSDLALEIIKEALSDDGQQYIFKSPLDDMPMERKAMATALRGTKYKNGKTKTPGILRTARARAVYAARSVADGGDDVRRAWPVGGRYLALPRPSAEQGRERQAAASYHPQGLQPRHARPGSEEARGTNCGGSSASLQQPNCVLPLDRPGARSCLRRNGIARRFIVGRRASPPTAAPTLDNVQPSPSTRHRHATHNA
jgi:hypothetical protein